MSTDKLASFSDHKLGQCLPNRPRWPDHSCQRKECCPDFGVCLYEPVILCQNDNSSLGSINKWDLPPKNGLEKGCKAFLKNVQISWGDPDRETMHGCEFKNCDEQLIPAKNKQTWISRHLWWYQQSPWLPSDPIIHSFWLSGLLPWKCNPSLFPRFGPFH